MKVIKTKLDDLSDECVLPYNHVKINIEKDLDGIFYFKNGKLHNTNGAAIIRPKNNYYIYNGKIFFTSSFLSNKDFKKKLKKFKRKIKLSLFL